MKKNEVEDMLNEMKYLLKLEDQYGMMYIHVGYRNVNRYLKA